MIAESESTIKILIIIPSLQCGGSEKYAAVLCNNINTHKFTVTLAIINNETPFYNITNKAITIIDLKVKQVRNSGFKIKRIIKQLKPDIVYTNANHLNLFLSVFKNFITKKTIVVARESSVVSNNSKRTKFPVLYNWLLKKYYRRIDYFVCQSQYMQQDLIEHYNIPAQKTVVINNPAQENNSIIKASLQNKFVTVARLSAEKGIDRLIRSVAQLTIPFVYHIIGDGDQKETLQNLIEQLHLQNKIFLEGKKDFPFSGMEDAALFLMGSYYEGFPNTLLEAGVLGIPAVAFAAPGGINEIISEYENGFLVAGNDEQKFRLTIEKAIATNFNRQQIKVGMLKKFPLKIIIKTTEDLFTQLYKKAKTN
jgi:glycosyltransferase involved in cell wall biosynthesis